MALDVVVVSGLVMKEERYLLLYFHMFNGTYYLLDHQYLHTRVGNLR